MSFKQLIKTQVPNRYICPCHVTILGNYLKHLDLGAIHK